MSDLARAMTALYCARIPVEELEIAALTEGFERVVRAFDEADLEYRAAIERILAPAQAREMFSAMVSFRREVVTIRAQIRAAAPYGDFDPLDTYVPPFSGSHADAVRAANLGDRAREAVMNARLEVNGRLGTLLSAVELERLVEAKRQREDAFEQAIRAAIPPGVGKRVAEQLELLAEGWY